MTINDELRAMRERADKAGEHIGRLCTGEDRWTMSVPVRDDDSDMLLGQSACIDLARLLDVLERVLPIHFSRNGYCNECGGQHPCATVRAISGSGDD